MKMRECDVRHPGGIGTDEGMADTFRRALQRHRQELTSELLAIDFLQTIMPQVANLPEAPSLSSLTRLYDKWSGLPFDELVCAVRCWLDQWSNLPTELTLALQGKDQPGRWRVVAEAEMPHASLRSL